MIPKRTYLADALERRRATLGWSVAELSRRAIRPRPAVSRALSTGNLNAQTADILIETMGGLKHEELPDGRLALVWGDIKE